MGIVTNTILQLHVSGSNLAAATVGRVDESADTLLAKSGRSPNSPFESAIADFAVNASVDD
jgi:hypothetical protein